MRTQRTRRRIADMHRCDAAIDHFDRAALDDGEVAHRLTATRVALRGTFRVSESKDARVVENHEVFLLGP